MRYIGTSFKRAKMLADVGWPKALPGTTAIAIARAYAVLDALEDGGEAVILAYDTENDDEPLSPDDLSLQETVTGSLKDVLFVESAGIGDFFSAIFNGLKHVHNHVINAINTGRGEQNAQISDAVKDPRNLIGGGHHLKTKAERDEDQENKAYKQHLRNAHKNTINKNQGTPKTAAPPTPKQPAAGRAPSSAKISAYHQRMYKQITKHHQKLTKQLNNLQKIVKQGSKPTRPKAPLRTAKAPKAKMAPRGVKPAPRGVKPTVRTAKPSLKAKPAKYPPLNRGTKNTAPKPAKPTLKQAKTPKATSPARPKAPAPKKVNIKGTINGRRATASVEIGSQYDVVKTGEGLLLRRPGQRGRFYVDATEVGKLG